MQDIQLTQQQKQVIKADADRHIAGLKSRLDAQIEHFKQRAKEYRDRIPQLDNVNIEKVSSENDAVAMFIAKTLHYKERQQQLANIQDAPYFIKLRVKWKDTGEEETLYISKYELSKEHIYSWVAAVSTLRFAELGEARYDKPGGGFRAASIEEKENFLIVDGEIVFMTHEDEEYARQVIYQKHMDERKEFMLPEIVAELDKLQDQIIRSKPEGYLLISGPAGSGKTTLALHRVAYLVLTPEFRDFFVPDRITVFVADQGAVDYFSKLLPELGIDGVNIRTFDEWSLMIMNSRFKSTSSKNQLKFTDKNYAVDFIREHNPLPHLHPRLVLDEYRKIKQELIMPIVVKEGGNKHVHKALHTHYLDNIDHLKPELASGFKRFLSYQKKNLLLDEVDIIILLKSLDRPIRPYLHIVVDEVQNWLPEQLEFISSLVSRTSKSVTFIGDIRQKTKAFSVQGWEQLGEEFQQNKNDHVELLKVYRNTKQILEFLKAREYDVSVDANARSGEEVEIITNIEPSEARKLIVDLIAENKERQIGVLAKYQDSLAGYEYLDYENENVHVLTVEEAQGLEFHTVIILDSRVFEQDEEEFGDISYTSKQEYTEQNKHLFYVAATRAQEKLVLIN